MTSSHTPAISQRDAPELYKSTRLETEGVGNAGCRCTRSLACKVIMAHEHSHYRFSRFHPAFPHAMVLTAYFVLSPVIGLYCHRHPRIKVLSARSGSQNLRET
jgi:hypothetical protein